MLKRLMVLGGMLAMMLALAAPAMAQADKEYSGTGLLPEPSYNAPGEANPLYTLTDEATGTSYELYSGFVELEDFEGQRVYFEGLQQGPPTQGPIQVNVTYMEAAPEYDAAPEAVVTGLIQPVDELSPEGGTHTITETETGAIYNLWSDAVDLTQYEGTQSTIYGIFQTQGAPISNFEDPTDVLIAVNEVEVVGETPSDEPTDDSVNLAFELTVEGQAPADQAFFGYVPAEGGISVQLTDPDGDGLYTGNMDVPQYAPGPRPVPEGTDPVTLPVQIVQTAETRDGFPLNPAIIEDFGQVLMDEDKAFTANVSFDSPTAEDQYQDEGTVESGGTVESDGGILDVLPDTGGFSMVTIGLVAALLLGGGGLLAYSFIRR